MLTFGTFLAADVTPLLTVRTHSQSHLLGVCVCVWEDVCVCKCWCGVGVRDGDER